MQLHQWQSACIQKALKLYRNKQEHFLCLATPGAGKTVMASVLADRLLKAGKIDMVVCLSPSTVVATDFKYELEKITDRRMDGMLGSSGVSITYQSMRTLDDNFWELFEQFKILVIFDEIHHCAGSNDTNYPEHVNAWGETIITKIQGRATYTLAMTGTPWRSDQLPIVLARYCDQQQIVKCDYQYGLKEAINDNVCRAPLLTAIDNNQVEFQRNGDGKSYESFKSLLESSNCSYQELLESPALIRYCFNQADLKLNQLRRQHANAAGLVVATSVSHAHAIGQILASEFNEHAIIVTHKEEDALGIIKRFKLGKSKWIISVGMISEGTNIPRLQVCCHLTRVKTELYFRQILGRVLRTQGRVNEYGYLFMPAEPTLVEYAQRVVKDIPDSAKLNLTQKIKGLAINPTVSSLPHPLDKEARPQTWDIIIGTLTDSKTLAPSTESIGETSSDHGLKTLSRGHECQQKSSQLENKYRGQLRVSDSFTRTRLNIGRLDNVLAG